MHVAPSNQLSQVRYEIRGELSRRAHALAASGREIIRLNIGNPGLFGFEAPAELREAIAGHVPQSEAYCHQKGLVEAREAVLARQRARGVSSGSIDHVFMGNGVSELIDLALRGLLNPGDEVLVPAPDYPLWTAAVILNGGRAVHYPCESARGWQPDPDAIEARITPRTRALVIINPNNPTGAVYPRALLERLVQIAEKHRLVLFSDEIYDHVLYDGAQFQPLAPLVENTLCVTLGGLSKVQRACGWRVGWMALSGKLAAAEDYLHALDLLSALRLCSNVPGQWAVPAALSGESSIDELTAPGGRLHASRAEVIAACARSRFVDAVTPQGALYAFVRVDTRELPGFDDHRFALELLERRNVLVVPGTSFNVNYRDHFRITLLPQAPVLREVFERIESLLTELRHESHHEAGVAVPARAAAGS